MFIGKAYYSLIYYIRTARFINNQYGLSVSILTHKNDNSLMLVDNAEGSIPYDINTLMFMDRYGTCGHFTDLKAEHSVDKVVSLGDNAVHLYYRNLLPKV